MPDERALPCKRDVARALLLKGTVFLHLDPRERSVNVPEYLRDQPQLVLQIGLDMPIPIPDLKVDDKGVFGTLSFNRAPHTCEVPWDAVFAVVGEDGRGMVWPNHMPPEIAAEVEREQRRGMFRDVNADNPAQGPSPDAGGRSSAVRSSSQSPRRTPRPAPARLEDDDISREVGPKANPLRHEGNGRRGDRDSGDQERRKRPLPPYLRVVK